MEADMVPDHIEEYKALTGLYQYYLGLTVQTVTLAMTVTSGVVAYAVKGEGNPQRRAYALALPAALCIGLGAGFLMQRAPAVQLKSRLDALTKEFGFGLAPHVSILVNAVTWLGLLMLVTGIVLMIVATFQLTLPKGIEVKTS
jgi:uncharacterized membrane protein